jgi:bifunctional non-homologous end joining protein LigD
MPRARSPRPTRDHHPATRRGAARRAPTVTVPSGVRLIPRDQSEAVIALGRREVRLTNLQKPFWPDLGLTKGDLLQYYLEVAPVLLPHLRDRAMVMKRYPNGAAGDFFFMKRAPAPRPDWIEICAIEHASGNVIDFPMIQDVPALLWVVNLGCIDLNQWYARCDDVDRPDYLHFDLDPGKDVPFPRVAETALILREALGGLDMPSLVKTTGSRGIHIYVPIVRGPTQKQVWTFTKALAHEVAAHHPKLMTTEYTVAKRPAGRVLLDYNQNAWGRTLASVYSVRPHPRACVSTPVTWKELEAGISIEDFRIDNVPARVEKLGDLWAPLVSARGRFPLTRFV